MAKQSGLGDSLYVHGFDLSGDVGAVQTMSTRSGQLGVTSINRSGNERIYGLEDGELTFNAFFNDDTDQEHDVLAAKGSGADRICTYFHGAAIGNAAFALVSKQINYDLTRGQDGALDISVQMLADQYGANHCVQLTPGIRTDASADDGTSLDNGASSAHGLVGYLQVFDIDSGTADITVESSSDDGSGDAFAAVLTFDSVTAAGAQRKATAAVTTAVEQYLRVDTGNTFTNLDFAVCVSRSLYAI